MKKFWEKYSIYIVLVFTFIVLLKGCNEVRILNEVEDTIHVLQDSTFTKTEYNDIFVLTQIYQTKVAEREGLQSELRFYQATDRRLMDVERQSEVHEKIRVLDKEINELENKLYEKMAK